jgi:acetyl-CoA synthetase
MSVDTNSMTDVNSAQHEVVCRPSAEHIERSRLMKFMRRFGINDLAELQRKSVENPSWFWEAVLEDIGWEWKKRPSKILDTSAGLAWSKWFVDGRVNYTTNALDRHVRGNERNKLALIWEGEDGKVRRLTYRETLEEVNRLANGLRSLGVGKGDRVGIFMPLTPEVGIASLACSRIGAIYTPIFSGYAASAVASRLQDSEAKVLITADGFYRRGNVIAMKETADQAVRESPSVEHVIVYSRLGRDDAPWTDGRDIWWHELLAAQSRVCEPEDTAADDPMMIIYTSGTTGKPKGAVHTHTGFPLKAAQDMSQCFDVQGDDLVFWFTDMGWMMGPWLFCGSLILGATAFLYEGTPEYPKPDRVWDMVERHGVTLLGISPTAIRGLMPYGDEWATKHDLSSLRALGSTGEPWNPEPYMWYFEKVGGGRCPILNYSGGTEISGGIIGCFTITPLKPASFSGPVPGIAADVVDDEGRSIRGEVGELIIRNSWPGMTNGFWKDPDRYLEAYWSRWPDIWVHGDWALIDDEGFWYIQGRSDDTIKIAGKRLGPAEVESAAITHPAVQECAAIGVPHELKGQGVVCFVILRPGNQPSDQLREEIKDAVATVLGKPMRPEAVKFTKDIPKTRNAKIMRRLIRAKYLGAAELGDMTGLENPNAIDEIGAAV